MTMTLEQALERCAELEKRVAYAEAQSEKNDHDFHQELLKHINEECDVCGASCCDLSDPMDFHHDGCPSEWFKEQQLESRAKKAEMALAAALEREREYQEAIRLANPYMQEKVDCAVIHADEWTNDPAVRRALGGEK